MGHQPWPLGPFIYCTVHIESVRLGPPFFLGLTTKLTFVNVSRQRGSRHVLRPSSQSVSLPPIQDMAVAMRPIADEITMACEVLRREAPLSSTTSGVQLARFELLSHVITSAVLRENDQDKVEPMPTSGIKRQMTPDSKVAQPMKRLAKWDLDKDHVKRRNHPSLPCNDGTEACCQVCSLAESRWVRGQPCLLNAANQAVRIPGHFCSKECYEHI